MAANKKVTRKVEINFTEKGLEKLSKEFKKLIAAAEKNGMEDAILKLEVGYQKLIKSRSSISEFEKISVEEAQKLNAEYEIANKILEENRKKILEIVNKQKEMKSGYYQNSKPGGNKEEADSIKKSNEAVKKIRAKVEAQKKGEVFDEAAYDKAQKDLEIANQKAAIKKQEEEAARKLQQINEKETEEQEKQLQLEKDKIEQKETSQKKEAVPDIAPVSNTEVDNLNEVESITNRVKESNKKITENKEKQAQFTKEDLEDSEKDLNIDKEKDQLVKEKAPDVISSKPDVPEGASKQPEVIKSEEIAETNVELNKTILDLNQVKKLITEINLLLMEFGNSQGQRVGLGKDQKVNLVFFENMSKSIKKVLDIFGNVLPNEQKESVEKISQSLNVLEEDFKRTGGNFTQEFASMFVRSLFDIINGLSRLDAKLVQMATGTLDNSLEKAVERTQELEKLLKKEERAIEKTGLSEEDGKLKVSDQLQKEILKNLVEQDRLSQLVSTKTGAIIENSKSYHFWLKAISETEEKLSTIQGQSWDPQKFVSNAKYRQQILKLAKEQGIIDSKKITDEQLLEQIQNRLIIKEQEILNIEERKESYNASKKQRNEYQKEYNKSLQEEERIRSSQEKELSSEETGQSIVQLSSVLRELIATLKGETKGAFDELRSSYSKTKKDGVSLSKGTQKISSDFGQAAKNVFSYGLAFQALRRIYRETIRTIKELDQAFTEMAIVTKMSREETWALHGAFNELASETGFTTTEIAKLSTIYFRQGRALKDVIELTRVAAQAARVAGISAEQSANYLTAAVNGFGLAADMAEATSDKFAALAASSASSYEELAVGLSKFASQAKVAGLSMDFAIGLLAKGVETTREAPESIGTALKTVLARMREITDLGKTLEDGMDVSRVEGALGNIGVALRDTQGQFRDMEGVITEVGSKWDTLNKNQQASVAVALAGTRQQSRLLAMFQDFDRTLELVDVSEESAGATMAQHAEYMQGMEAALASLNNAWQGFIKAITDSEVIIDIIKLIAWTINSVVDGFKSLGIGGRAWMAMIGVLIIATKGLNTVMKINLALKGFSLKATIKEAAATELSISGKIREALATKILTWFKAKETTQTWALVAARLAANAALLGAAAGIAFLIVLIAKGIKKRQEENKALKEKNEALQVERYEINQTIKSIDSLIKKYDELNSKRIKTDADVEALKELGEQLRELENEDFKVIEDIYGNVDVDSTIVSLQKYLKIQEQERRDTIKQEFNNTLFEYKKQLNKIGLATEQYINEFSENFLYQNQGFISNFLMNELSLMKEIEFTQDQLKTLKNFYSNFISTDILAEFARGDYSNLDFIQEQADLFLTRSEKVFEDLNLAYSRGFDDLLIQYRRYKNQLEEEGSDSAKALLYSLESEYAVIDFFSEIFDEAEKISLLSANFSVDQIDNISRILETSGYVTEEIFQDIERRLNAIFEKDPNMNYWNALSIAVSESASGIEDATAKMALYELSMRRTIQEMAQNFDKIESGTKRISEVLDKIKKGELSGSEIYDFAQDYQEVFENEELFERFLKGESLYSLLLDESLSQYNEMQSTVITNLNRISKAEQDAIENKEIWTEAQKEENDILIKSLTAQNNQLRFLMAYRTSILNVTDAQREYNKLLKQSNLLLDLGIIDEDLQQNLLDRLKVVTAEDIKSYSNTISEAFIEVEEEFGKNYIEIINGIAFISNEAIDDLSEDQISRLGDYLNIINSSLDSILLGTKNLMESELKQVEEINKKKKESYEKYFDSIDRLQKEQESEQTREEIVQQLMILEGATDERSRQKAKELRADLIKLDEDAQKDSQEEARDALLNRLDAEVETIKALWEETIFPGLLNALETGGANAGKEFLQYLKTAGIITEEQYNRATGRIPIAGGSSTEELIAKSASGINQPDFTIMDQQTTTRSSEDQLYKEALNKLFTSLDSGMTDFNNQQIYWHYKDLNFNKLKSEWDINSLNDQIERYRSNPSAMAWFLVDDGIIEPDYDKSSHQRSNNVGLLSGYKKGGLVDYTGLAMVHGSNSKPEAFLNSSQTEMFSNLAKTLSRISVSPNSFSENINIENISISTNNLNNNQDFKNAGEILAGAFKKAISGRGIPVNTKR